jgi:integrase
MMFAEVYYTFATPQHKNGHYMQSKKAFPKPRVHADFPLSWHKGVGQWMKKFTGKQHYFGADPNEALTRYLAEKDYLIAGVEVPVENEHISVRDLVNLYLENRERDRDSAKTSTSHITERTFAEYRDTGSVMVAMWNHRSVSMLTPMEFAKLRHKLDSGSPDRLRRRMTNVRSILKWGRMNGLLKADVNYGSEFNLADKSQMRKAKANREKPIFDAETIRKALDAAWPSVKAFILLGINCGFYAKDISDLNNSYIEGEFITFAREKTGIDRRCWLWPETRAAIAAAKAPENAEDRVFLSKRGKPLHVAHGLNRTDLVASNWHELKEKIGLTRSSSGFKNFRHTFRSEAGGAKDAEAVRLFMGHTDGTVGELYQHNFDEQRLIDVGNHVHAWLFPKPKKKPAKKAAKRAANKSSK